MSVRGGPGGIARERSWPTADIDDDLWYDVIDTNLGGRGNRFGQPRRGGTIASGSLAAGRSDTRSPGVYGRRAAFQAVRRVGTSGRWGY
jgi:hypothetical protein